MKIKHLNWKQRFAQLLVGAVIEVGCLLFLFFLAMSSLIKKEAGLFIQDNYLWAVGVPLMFMAASRKWWMIAGLSLGLVFMFFASELLLAGV
jgi:hypothetical protein